MSDFLDSLKELLRERSESIMETASTNIQLGRILHERYHGNGEEKLPGLAIALAKEGCPVPPDFLSQVYRVYKAIGGEAGFERLKARRRTLSWSGLVKEFSRPPAGNAREAVSFWSAFMKDIENTQDKVDILIEHFHDLPDEVKPQAEGLIISMGYSTSSFPSGIEGLVVRTLSYKGGARKLRVLHVADQHFRDKDLEEIKKSAAFIVKAAKHMRPHLIISAGDLLDERQYYDTPAFRKAVAFIKALANTAPVLVLQGTSDHDGRTVEVLSHIGARHAVRVMDRIGCVGLHEGTFDGIEDIDTLDALIYTIPPVSKAELVSRAQHSLEKGNKEPFDLLRSTFTLWNDLSAAARTAGIPVILAGHLMVKGSVMSTGQQATGRTIDLGTEDLQQSGADLVLLGHVHKMQYRDNVFYSGSIARLNYGEEEDKGFWVHEFSPDGLLSRFIIIPTRPRLTFEFNEKPDLSLLHRIPEITSGASVRIKYKVRQEELATVDERAIERAFRDKGAVEVLFERSVIPQQRVRAAGISQIRSLEEKLRKYAEINGLSLSEGILSKLTALEEDEMRGPAQCKCK
ncbi:MAG: metallophosphoesterase family protein [Nitrospirota bacterium]